MSLGLGDVASVAGTIAGAFRRRRKSKMGNIIRDYAGKRAEGYTSDADRLAAERTRGRGTASASRSAELARIQGNRQATARGLSGAAAAALDTKANDIEAAGRESAYGAGEDVLYGAYSHNKDLQAQKDATIFGTMVADETLQNQQADAQQSTFWNSILQGIQTLSPMLPAIGQRPGSTAVAPGGVVGGVGAGPHYDPRVGNLP